MFFVLSMNSGTVYVFNYLKSNKFDIFFLIKEAQTSSTILEEFYTYVHLYLLSKLFRRHERLHVAL